MKDLLRRKLAPVYAWLVSKWIGKHPILYPSGSRHIPVWLKEVTYRVDPDGVRFFLRCTESRFDESNAKDALKRIRVLSLSNLQRIQGHFLYERENEDHFIPRDKAGGGHSDPRGEHRFRGLYQGYVDGTGGETGGSDAHGPRE